MARKYKSVFNSASRASVNSNSRAQSPEHIPEYHTESEDIDPVSMPLQNYKMYLCNKLLILQGI